MERRKKPRAPDLWQGMSESEKALRREILQSLDNLSKSLGGLIDATEEKLASFGNRRERVQTYLVAKD